MLLSEFALVGIFTEINAHADQVSTLEQPEGYFSFLPLHVDPTLV